MTKFREPTETDKMFCPLCRDGYPIIDGKEHDALGFMWRCQATIEDPVTVTKRKRVALTVGDLTIEGNVG